MQPPFTVRKFKVNVWAVAENHWKLKAFSKITQTTYRLTTEHSFPHAPSTSPDLMWQSQNLLPVGLERTPPYTITSSGQALQVPHSFWQAEGVRGGDPIGVKTWMVSIAHLWPCCWSTTLLLQTKACLVVREEGGIGRAFTTVFIIIKSHGDSYFLSLCFQLA